MPSLSLRVTSLFLIVSFPCSSNWYTIISAWCAPLCYPSSELIYPIFFACYNTLYFSHSDIIFSLCSNLISLLLSPRFYPFSFTALQLVLIITLSSIWSYFISYNIWLLLWLNHSILIARIILDQFAQFLTVFCSSGLSDLY